MQGLLQTFQQRIFIHWNIFAHKLHAVQLAEESNTLTVFSVVKWVSVACRTHQRRVRHFTPTYDMTKELQQYIKFISENNT